MAYVETSNRRNAMCVVVTFIGLTTCTALSVAYSNTVRGEVFGMFGAGFGMVTALLVLSPGPPIPPSGGADDAFLVRLYRTSRRMYYLSFLLVPFWLGMMAWRVVSLWRLR